MPTGAPGSRTSRGYAFMLAAATLWGLLGPASYVAMREGVTALEVAFWRALLAGVAFWLHALLAGGGTRSLWVARRDWPVVVAFGAIGIAFLYTAYFTTVRLGGAALAAVLLYTAPAWVALLSWMLGRERLTPRTVLALVVTFAGVALVAGVGGDVRVSIAAVIWGLASGVAYALYYVLGAPFFARYPPPTLFAWALPLGALALLPLVEPAPKGPVVWAALGFVALVPTYGAYLCYAAALRYLAPTRASTVAMLEPVVAAVAAWMLFGERLTVTAMVGAVVVLAGVLLMVAREPAAVSVGPPTH